MKHIFLGLLLVTTSVFSQKGINGYKYIIIPNQFEFVKQPDKYQTSSLTKFLFNKYGFTAYLDTESFPKDLGSNNCLALVANVVEKSGLFTTKIIIELKNCYNEVVYTSAIGKSKSKDFKKAYHEAIRSAFDFIRKLNYKYVPIKEIFTKTNTPKEVPVRKGEKIGLPAVVTQSKQTANTMPVAILYAQAKNNGFQLVNTKPEVVFDILQTTIKDIYILKNKNGILYKKDAFWVAEYYDNGAEVIKKYQVKF